MVTIRKAQASDGEFIALLLKKNQLPSADIGNDLRNFFVLEAQGKTIASIGLQVDGSTALLRSLVVEKKQQGKGYGNLLCRHIITEARRMGIKKLFLLTEDASLFFAKKGFQILARAQAPDVIKKTAQYQHLCPQTATVMILTL